MRALLLALALAQIPHPAAGSDEAKAAQERLAQEKRHLAQLLQKRQSVLDALDAAAQEAAQEGDLARKAAAEERGAAARLTQATAEAEAAQGALLRRIAALRPRLLARYRLDRGGAAQLLLSSRSLGDLLWRQRTLNRVLASDLSLLRETEDESARLDAAMAKQRAVEAEHRQRAQEAEAQRLAAKKKRDELTALLAAVEARKEAKEKAVAELEEAAAKLQALATRAPVLGFTAASSFETLRGHLLFPTAGRIEVGFGRVINPKFNTVIVQKGVDIRAPEGQEVIAVAPGRVMYAGWFRGYGNLVIVDHGKGYFSLFAHLASIARQVGDEVQAGEVLGQVGETDSLKGPYLHFEIRKHGRPLDPSLWLSRP